jgi:DNA-directed RNA polymerase sigma subunit (sigma70/sigma32)
MRGPKVANPGDGAEMTLEEIAAELCISRARVWQLYQSAMTKLRRRRARLEVLRGLTQLRGTNARAYQVRRLR